MVQKTIQKKEKTTGPGLCALCRGTKFLCGKDRCPVMVRYFSKTKVKPFLDTTHLGGASPPSVFVGRYGYPKITIGPMIPPTMGDTTIIDTPEPLAAQEPRRNRRLPLPARPREILR